MKRYLTLLFALMTVSCASQESRQGLVKSIELQYRPDIVETYSFSYDAKGRLSQIQIGWTNYDGEKNVDSYSYSYNEKDLTAKVKIHEWRMERTAQARFQGDFSHMTYFQVGEDKDEDPETGIQYLGRSWEGAYEKGCLTKSTLTEFTSDGIEVALLSWDENGLITSGLSEDPAVCNRIQDIQYLDTPNPFTGVDPLAMLLMIKDFYWQGLAGERPGKLIQSYTQIAEEWTEEPVTSRISFSYQTNADGLITRIDRLNEGEIERSVLITY